MSLVENLVNQISTKGLGGVTKPQGFDLDDNTFENLLQKAGMINNNGINENLLALGNLGQPSGLVIEPFEETSKVQQVSNEDKNIIDTSQVQIKDVDTGSNYFSNLLKDAPNEHKSLMNVAQKHATGIYNILGKGLVENIVDFAKDVTST